MFKYNSRKNNSILVNHYNIIIITTVALDDMWLTDSQILYGKTQKKDHKQFIHV